MGFSKQDVKNIYPLTPIQEGMLFHALKEKDSSAYFQQTSWRISGHFDRDVFDAAWLKLVQRHDIMRTLFTYEHSDKPLQVVLKAVSFKVEHIDLLDHDFEQRENLCEYYRTADRLQSFQLDHAPLMRVSVLHLAHDQWEIIWSHHHILMDGWSYGILLQEFMLLYQRKLDIELPPAPPFSSYVKWLSHKPLPTALAYWKAHLKGYEQCIEIPFKRFPSPKIQSFDEVNFSLSPENHDRLTRLTKENSLTLNSVLQGLVALLLSRYCDVDDLVFGTVVSGRPPDLQQIENMVGNFINTIPTRVKIDWNATALEFLKNIQFDQLQSTEYQFCPLSQIQGSTDVKGDLFNVVMAVENYPLDEMVSTAATRDQIGFGIDRVFSFDKTHYDFDIQFIPSGDGSLNAKIIFDSAKYDAKYINNIPALFEVVVEALCNNPRVPLKDNLLLSAMDKQAVLHDFINTSAQHIKPGPDTLVHRFALQVAATPDAPAVKDDQHELSYRELDQRSNQLANHLINLGIEAEQPVALCTSRSTNLLVAMLGILKSGGAYLPMDLSQPMARLAMQAKDASVRFILSDHNIAPDSSLDELLSVCRDNHNSEGLCGIHGAQNQSVHCILLEDVYDLPVSTPNPVSDHHNSGQIRENQLAYIIYTSGSTGIPKGTLVEHHSVVNLVDAI
ncbi:MAG: condensation domain-containing protein, partial [Pseudomonadales bacterium]|nr:condensation domain-containing protein [Pseudomonadales bacterium]